MTTRRCACIVCVAPGRRGIRARLGVRSGFVQDPDVLDTWFSSALWPHSTLGWPEPTPELTYYYPTSVLVTSRDIITLWVARMVLTGLYNLGDVPFHHVYIHPKMLDGFGETMSKSKGNGVDPLDIIDRYGTDALRFGMVSHRRPRRRTAGCRWRTSARTAATLVPVKQEHMYMRTKKLDVPEVQEAVPARRPVADATTPSCRPPSRRPSASSWAATSPTSCGTRPASC